MASADRAAGGFTRRITTAVVDGWGRAPTGGARLLDSALVPFEWSYRLGSALYHGAYSANVMTKESADLPVISIGNLVVGGAGKTPVAGWITDRLLSHGYRPALVHGGYGRDEPELHRNQHPDTPIIVHRNRKAGCREAKIAGADVVILDDGFQHRRLNRDLDIVLVPVEGWSRRPRLLPRGPWREPPRALGRAHVIAVTRKTADCATAERIVAETLPFSPNALTIMFALRPGGWRRPTGAIGGKPPSGDVLAVSAIARPDAFLANAREAGARVSDAWWFPDHYEYGAADAERIRARARRRSIVTTAKDAVKLRQLEAVRPMLWVLEQDVVIEYGEEDLMDRLERAIRR